MNRTDQVQSFAASARKFAELARESREYGDSPGRVAYYEAQARAFYAAARAVRDGATS